MDFWLEGVDARFLLVQGIGFIGFGIYVLSYQRLNPRHTMLQQACANAVLISHVYLLGQVFVTILATLGAFRDAGSALVSKKAHIFVIGIYSVLLFVAALFVADQLLDWLGVAGGMMMVTAQFFRDRFYAYRLLCFVSQAFWLAVDIMIFSIPGTIFMSAMIISNAIGIVRFMRQGRGAV